MKVCVPKEKTPGERRVALVPDVAGKLAQAGFEIVIEPGAGSEAELLDAAYEEAGVRIASGDPLAEAEGVALVRAPDDEQIGKLKAGTVLVGFLSPLNSPELVKKLAQAQITSFAMEAIPRTTRAQSMDALSSQALCAGYRATLAAASLLGKFFPMNITAAGTAKPARIVVLGAGVAGLQAIATSKRLGAVVEAYDLRPAVKEEVESLGAKFIQIDMEQDSADEGGGSGQYAKELTADQQRRQQELLAERIAAADCVITTAAVPGRPAPKIVSAAMAESMKPGSVIIDIASETGGNCELTKPGEVITHNRVTIDGTTDLPSQMPFHSSLLYANNVANLLKLLAPEGQLNVDFEDDIIAGACVTHDGEIVNERVKEAVGGSRMSVDLITNITIFVLAVFVGNEVISKVPTMLHTPLMSGTNAIHGIVLLGGLLVVGAEHADTLEKIAGTIAVIFGTINIVGGFLVTERMLEMFKPKEKPGDKGENKP